MDEIAEVIDAIELYSYQYNVKIVGIPEVHSGESETETSNLCVRLFRTTGAEISIQDIDIAHRTPSRSATSGPKPIICKFLRRLTVTYMSRMRSWVQTSWSVCLSSSSKY